MGVDSWPARGAASGATGASGTGRPVPGRPRQRPAPPTARHRPRAAGARPAARPTSGRSRTPGGGPLGDTRGLTAAGALVLLLTFGIVGSVVDRLLGHGLWVFFSVGFLAAVLLNAVRIHLEDLAASIVLVPIAYAISGAVPDLVSGLGSGSGLKQEIAAAAGVLVFGTPVLLLAVVVAAGIAMARGRSATLARQRARSRATRRFGVLPPGTRPRRPARPAGDGRPRR